MRVPADYRVVKMKLVTTRDPETRRSTHDKSTVIYNDAITLCGILLKAYDYVVNGRPALEWGMGRQPSAFMF
jgi:predicted helicase